MNFEWTLSKLGIAKESECSFCGEHGETLSISSQTMKHSET